MNYFVYIVECSDGSFYTGYTSNMNNRLHSHNETKSGAKYTKSRRPVKLIYLEQHPSKSTAMKKECEIKTLSREQKVELVKYRK